MERMQFGGRHVVGFGVGGWLFPDHDAKDVAALIKVFDARMKQLADSFKTYGPKWVVADPVAYNNFVLDYGLLLARYTAARASALILGLADPDKAFLLVSQAVRQNYPPDGAKEMKGDWVDLYRRLGDAQRSTNDPVYVDQAPTDLADSESNDLLMKFYKATAPYDVLARLTGEEKPFDTLEWIGEHKTAIAIGVTIVGGVVVYALIKR